MKQDAKTGPPRADTEFANSAQPGASLTTRPPRRPPAAEENRRGGVRSAVQPASDKSVRPALPGRGGLQRIAGRHNPRLKELRIAFRRGELTASGECAIEGAKLVEEALRSGQRVTGVFFSESCRSLADKLLPQISSRVEPLLLPDSLFRSIVPSDSPQGVAALVKIRSWSAEQLLERAGLGVFLAASGIQDPGNLGTMLRSAEAFGAAGVFLTEGTVSLFNPKVLRGSAGSVFRLPSLHISSDALIPQLKGRGVRLLATSSHKGTPLPQVSWSLPLAVFIGNEGAGLRRELMHQMDETIVIPLAEQVESLNAGVAASIVLYESQKSEVRMRK
jgi:RNA methyltransferase, TrmH family